jgi:hypothetical protein
LIDTKYDKSRNSYTIIKISRRDNWDNPVVAHMAEDLKTEAELDDEYLEEYAKLCKKYKRTISIEVRTSVVRVNFPE